MSGEHPIFPPSSMADLVHCHGMPAMVADLPPEDDSLEAREGTAAHWVCEKRIAGDVVTTGEVAPNGEIVTDEMLDGAQVYFEDIDRVTAVSLNPPVTVEEKVFMPQIHEECWGTPDSWWFDQRNWILHVWDYKFGHLRVKAEGNWQLAAYITGIVNKLFGVDSWPANLRVVAKIAQPRCYMDGLGPIQTWELDINELRPYINVMENACVQSQLPGAEISAGSHCTHCRARTRCPANAAQGAFIVDFSRQAVPRDLTPIGLDYEARVLDAALDRLKARKKAIDAEMEAHLRAGVVIPGRALEPSYGTRAWLIDPDTLYGTGDILGIDLRDTKPCTPAEAERRAKAASIDVNVLEGLSGKRQTGMKVVEDDGSRARRIFGKGEI